MRPLWEFVVDVNVVDAFDCSVDRYSPHVIASESLSEALKCCSLNFYQIYSSDSRDIQLSFLFATDRGPSTHEDQLSVRIFHC